MLNALAVNLVEALGYLKADVMAYAENPNIETETCVNVALINFNEAFSKCVKFTADLEP